jgi:hypothetical protein
MARGLALLAVHSLIIALLTVEQQHSSRPHVSIYMLYGIIKMRIDWIEVATVPDEFVL